MDQLVHKLAAAVRRYLRIILGLFLLAAALIGVVAILVAALLPQGTASVVIRDLGIGMIVSVFVTISIELYASARLRSEVATDVMEAIFQRLIPPVIWTQVATFVLRADVVCYNWELNIDVRTREEDTDAAAFEAKRGPGGH